MSLLYNSQKVCLPIDFVVLWSPRLSLQLDSCICCYIHCCTVQYNAILSSHLSLAIVKLIFLVLHPIGQFCLFQPKEIHNRITFIMQLWTFGHGRYGQLGHGSSDDISVPRTCLDLVGSKVTQVACGRYHTLVFLPSQVLAKSMSTWASRPDGHNLMCDVSGLKIHQFFFILIELEPLELENVYICVNKLIFIKTKLTENEQSPP